MSQQQTEIRAVSWSTQDRDESWPDTNCYEIDVPAVNGVAEIKMGSFEFGSLPRYTVEEGTDDEIITSEGIIVGCANDTSAMDYDPLGGPTGGDFYENEIRIYDKDATYVSAYIPAHDNVCSIAISSVSESATSPSQRAVFTVTADAPHGLEVFSTSCVPEINVTLICSPAIQDLIVATSSGLYGTVTINSDTQFTVTDVPTSVTAEGTFYGVLHVQPYLPSTLCSTLNSSFSARNLPWTITYNSKTNDYTMRRIAGQLSQCSLNFVYNDQDTFRGVALSLGLTSRTPSNMEVNVSKYSKDNFFGLIGNNSLTHKTVIPPGFYDISSLAVMVQEKMNTMNPGHTDTLGTVALQFGFTNSKGITSTISVSGGRYTPNTLSIRLQTLLQTNDAGISYTCEYDWDQKKWTISGNITTTLTDGSGTAHIYMSPIDFSIHFASSAQAGWATSSSSAQILAAARLLGFDATTYNSKNGSVVSGIVQYTRILRPLYAGAGGGTDGISFTHETESYRMPINTYVVGGKSPSQRLMTFTARNPHMLNVILTSTTTSNGTSSCLASPTGYSYDPPVPYEVGMFVNVYHSTNVITQGGTYTSRISGQILSVSVTSMVIRMDAASLTLLAGGTDPSSTNNVAVSIEHADLPSFAIHKANSSTKIGLCRSLESVRSQVVCTKPWNVEHPRFLLVRFTFLGPTVNTFNTIKIGENNVQVFAKLLISGTGYQHQHASIMESKCPPTKISKIKVEILNPEGTLYQTHNQDHSFTLMMISKLGN